MFLHLVNQSKPVLYIDCDEILRKPQRNIFQKGYERQFYGDYFLWDKQSNKTLILENLSENHDLSHLLAISKSSFERLIITTSSDIFQLFYRDDTNLVSFRILKIDPFSHTQQEELIKKRMALTKNNESIADGAIDQLENKVNSIIISNKILPRYPFYILSILQTQEAYMPIDLSITSYGHCYQALIVASLMKSGLQAEEIEVCFNFVENLAFYIYEKTDNGPPLKDIDFDKFCKKYREDYLIKQITINRMKHCSYGILTLQGSFKLPYIYYFFLGKSFSKNRDKHEDAIEKMCEMLHIMDMNHQTI